MAAPQVYPVPLLPGAAQTLSLALAGFPANATASARVTYRLALTWNTAIPGWVLDAYDAGGAPLARGLPLVPGVDLLEQLGSLGFPGGLAVVDTASNGLEPPTYASLGATGGLYYWPYPRSAA